MKHNVRHTGFTLIELMLAMTFIAVMLIAIAMLVIQISTIYNRGITLRQVNQAGRAVTSDMQRTIAGSSAFEVNQDALDRGRLCTGQYSYIWNRAEMLEHDDRNRYEGVQHEDEMIRLVRVPDTNGFYCHTEEGEALPRIDSANAVELLDSGDRPLVVHNLSVHSSLENQLFGQRLYTVSLTLGTDNMLAINDTGDRCLPPSEIESDLTYCAINQFTFTTRGGIL